MIDRLTTLLENFRLKVSAAASLDSANLVAWQDRENGRITLVHSPRMAISLEPAAELLVSLHVELGKVGSPLHRALPDVTEIEVKEGDEIHTLISVLAIEQKAQRCGAPIVLGRLGEVLMVRILRHQIDKQQISTGLLAGLAHDRLCRSIVAMHNDPGRRWNIADLADIAGLSESRFKELFAKTLGETPGNYLRQWRMNLARAEIEAGARIEQVARRYGYTAPDAFSRAFAKEFGVRPKKFATAFEPLGR